MRRLLIDGNNLAGRCATAPGVSELRRSDGHLSGTVHGVLQGLSYVRSKLKIGFEEMICVWDFGRCERRMALYPSYKAGRISSRTDLTEEEALNRAMYFAQLNALVEGLGLLGMKQLRVPGMEADDLLGIYSEHYAKQGVNVVIYSGDHDIHQLAGPKVSIFDPKKDLLNLHDVEELWGIPVSQIPSYKAIVGDKSDNIDGFKGLGDVRAKIILKHLKSPSEKPSLDGIPEKEAVFVSRVRDEWDRFQLLLELVEIPKSWKTQLYTPEHQEEALVQLLRPVKLQGANFLRFLKDWELHTLAEQARRWL